jgi:Tol biopolymer transport system component
MRSVWLAVMMVVAVLVSSPCWCDWHKGIVHFHSKYSDGMYNLDSIWQDAQKAGVEFIFMTEHADLMGNEQKFVEYVNRCQWLTQQGLPVMIPGLEFPLKDFNLKRHLLLLGFDKPEFFGPNWKQPPYKFWNFPYSPIGEIEFLRQLPQWREYLLEKTEPVLSVMAHPSLWKPPFDFSSYQQLADGITQIVPKIDHLDALEFFNSTVTDFLVAEREELGWYKKFLTRQPDYDPWIGITCGNDSHLSEVEWRYTYVKSPDLTPASLMDGIKSGKSYASVWGAEFKDLTFPTPVGFYTMMEDDNHRVLPGQKLTISFHLVWPRPLVADKEIRLLLDGEELAGSRKGYLIHTPGIEKELSYSFSFSAPSSGKHTLCIHSPGQIMGPQFEFVVEQPPTPVSPPPLPSGGELGRIAFVSNRDGNDEIYVMNADGTNHINLTNNPASDDFPSWSPDGTKIAFDSYRDGNYEIYVMNADGTNQTRLTNNPEKDCAPSWSPDGSRIAFYSVESLSGAGPDYRLCLWTVSPDGRNLRLVLSRDADEAYIDFQWSPDGSKFVFEPTDDQIYTINADGTNVRRLTAGATWCFNPSYDPRGGRIAFSGSGELPPGRYPSGEPDKEIWVFNADGSGLLQLTRNEVNDWLPRWSPDGSNIAFWSNRDDNREIYAMNADGTNQTRLTNKPEWCWDYEPSWSPDGTKIAFTSTRNGNDEIYVMNADGSGQTNLTNNSANDGEPAWRPTH